MSDVFTTALVESVAAAILPDAIVGYVACALWSSTDDDGNDLDATFTVDDIDDASREAMATDVRAFVVGTLEEYGPDIFDGIDHGQIGHDFWLTRNGHGAGFWDRGLGKRGETLSDMARPYGDAYLMPSDDGTLFYQS